MKSIFANVVIATALAASVAAMQLPPNCYEIGNYGITPSCSQCKDGYVFFPESVCLPEVSQCCKGVCCTLVGRGVEEKEKEKEKEIERK